jgi:hypothetical protein
MYSIDLPPTFVQWLQRPGRQPAASALRRLTLRLGSETNGYRLANFRIECRQFSDGEGWRAVASKAVYGHRRESRCERLRHPPSDRSRSVDLAGCSQRGTRSLELGRQPAEGTVDKQTVSRLPIAVTS